MTRTKARFGVLLALGAIALLAVSGIAVAKHRSHHHSSDGSATIASFDTATGRLTLELFDGEEVSGLVTKRTRIKCEDEHSPDVTARQRHGESEPGDDNGGHGEEPGDDNGGHGLEPGDDNGGQGNEPGDDHQGDNSGPGSAHSGPSGHDDNGSGANCTSSDLIPGAFVEEAELESEHGQAIFRKFELAD
jgi:hypothetical protein